MLGRFLSQLRLQIGAPNEELVVLTQSHTVLEAAVNLGYRFGEANDDLRVASRDLITKAQLPLIVLSPRINSSLV